MFRVNVFATLLKQLPRGVFDAAVERFEGDKHRKGFSCWRQLVAMLYAQLGDLSSLRVLTQSFNSQRSHHYHLGCASLNRSTLADANERTDWRIFEATAQALMGQVARSVRGEAKQLLLLLDSTSLTLKGTQFDAWTQDTRTRHTQGMKLHVSFAAGQAVPLDCLMSAPNLNDIEYARTRTITPGATYVFDKAYCDYRWWWAIEQHGARFVTRLKLNARIEVLAARAIPRNARGKILKDEQMILANPSPGGGRRNPYIKTLRRIEVAREGKPALVLVTNDLKRAALTIAELYKARWQIELFFKWIKQHLRIKRFLGRSENAVRIQILCALIAYLLAHLHAQVHATTESLWMVLAQLRSTLFQRPQIEAERHRRWREQRDHFKRHQRPLFA